MHINPSLASSIFAESSNDYQNVDDRGAEIGIRARWRDLKYSFARHFPMTRPNNADQSYSIKHGGGLDRIDERSPGVMPAAGYGPRDRPNKPET